MHFGLDGMSYEIDLTTDEAAALRAALDAFISAARVEPSIGTREVDTGVTDGHHSSRQIREWAMRNGFEVAPRGRIPAAVAEAFTIAH